MSTPIAPQIVRRARALAERLGFASSCSDEVGTVLRLLAINAGSRRIGEIGTGCGVGTAWLASGLQPGAVLSTVEIDEQLAGAVRALFEVSPQVSVMAGDWHELLSRGPFDLLFVDVASAKEDEAERVADALAPGGIAVLDDLTPEEQWTDQQRRQWSGGDPVRLFWLRHPSLVAAELRMSATSSIVLAARAN
jgi:predicted O-methyltransferase YrrM